MKTKPDCTKQRFGKLTVLGKGDRVLQKTNNPKYKTGFISVQLWRCRCDCGNIVEKPRNYFDRPSSPNPSCGCGRRDSARANGERRAKPDCTGRKFGYLTVLGKTKESKKYSSGNSYMLWALRCECGKIIKIPRGYFDRKNGQQSCGCKTAEAQHRAGRKLKYPSTPNPYPQEAGELLAKYLFLTKTSLVKKAPEIEDRKRDRLIRACWILVYRRSQGEYFSESRERAFLARHVSRCDTDTANGVRRYVDGEISYNAALLRIGGEMTDVTFQDYPVCESETQGNFNDRKPTKRLQFKRY